MKNRNIKTTFGEIISFWETKKYEGDLGVDWSDAHEKCWRCATGGVGRLQKCHIVPRSLGGNEEPSNLVLLCSRCHKEAPNSKNPEAMWDWIKATKFPFYDMFWTMRGFEEYKKIYGDKLSDAVVKISQTKITKATKDSFQEVSVHFGEGGINPSSLASVFKSVEDKLIGPKV